MHEIHLPSNVKQPTKNRYYFIHVYSVIQIAT